MNCRDDDGGMYVCKVRNKFGIVFCEVVLVVVEDIVLLRFIKKFYDFIVDFGNIVEFFVKYIGSLELKVKWYLDDEEVFEDDEGMDIDIEFGLFLLVLEDIVLNDFGQYKCIIFNVVGKVVISVQFKVSDEGKEIFLISIQWVVEVVFFVVEKRFSGKVFMFIKEFLIFCVIEGDVVWLEVIVDGLFRLVVQWFVENDYVVEDEYIYIV